MSKLEPLAEIGSSLKLPAAIPQTQTPAAPAPAAVKKPSKRKLKLVEKAASLKDLDGDGKMRFLATYLVKCTLPHRDPGNVPVWTRKNAGGNETLVVQPGWDLEKGCSTGYPYGALPRLILIWMVTEAKRLNNPRIELGSSFAEFARTLEIDGDRGGKRSMAKNLQKQLRRLLSCHISFHRGLKGPKVYSEGGKLYATEGTEGYELENAAIARKHALWWETGKPVLTGPTPVAKERPQCWIELSLDFFESITRSAVPFKLEAVSMLKGSPLELDLYVLCAYLAHYLQEKKLKKHLLTWKALSEQLGCQYADESELGRKVRAAMKHVKLAYPELRFQFVSGGLDKGGKARKGGMEILPSRLAVKLRSQRTGT